MCFIFRACHITFLNYSKLPKYQTRLKLNAFTCSQCMELQNAKNQFGLKCKSSSSEVNLVVTCIVYHTHRGSGHGLSLGYH